LEVVVPGLMLVLEREDYLRLELEFLEMTRFRNQCYGLEHGIEVDRSVMLCLKPRARFLFFAEKYGFALRYLPNRVCASFVHLHETDYCRFKSEYLRSV